MPNAPHRNRPLMLAYWGRRGALCRFTYNLALEAARIGQPVSISVSRANELFKEFAELGDSVFPVETFSSSFGAIAGLPKVLQLRAALAARFVEDGTRAFVSVLSNIWSPLTTNVIRRAGVRHLVVVHDAESHPGDRTAVAIRWLLREARAADKIVTLSRYVSQRLTAEGGIAPGRITTLFHPDIDYGCAGRTARDPGAPLRILFFGRMLQYKGVGLFAEAVDILRREQSPIEVGVFGAGALGGTAERLAALGAEVENRWLGEHEIKHILGRHDLVVVSHLAASQSGVVSTAFGAGLPVVVTPVGGLPEQVEHEISGLVAESVTAEAIAQCIRRLAGDRVLFEKLRAGVAATADRRSMARFLNAITALALGDGAREV
jgi:glycosyltransferase involved in cell wall biosynthesis